uniref:Uncharacterized protein n=1 Tax=Otolemur garnettii TaxID=30611 RepID=H0XPL8_OTOGA
MENSHSFVLNEYQKNPELFKSDEEPNLPERIPQCSQHFVFCSHQRKDVDFHRSKSPGTCRSKTRGRDEENMAKVIKQEAQQQTVVLENILGSLEGVKENVNTQKMIKCTSDQNSLPTKSGNSGFGGLSDEKTKRKLGGDSAEKPEELQRDLLTMGMMSALSDSIKQEKVYKFLERKSLGGPKCVTMKAKQLHISQLFNIRRHPTEGHRKKKQHHRKYKMKEKQWYTRTRKELFSATEDAKSPPAKSVLDKLSFRTATRGTPSNRILQQNNVDGHSTEEKEQLPENLGTTSLGPADFFTAVLSDSKTQSQTNTAQLSGREIRLNPKRLTVKEKKSPVSRILKVNRQSTAKDRKKLEYNIKIKLKAMRQGQNVADTFPNAAYLTPDTSDIKIQSRFQTEMDTGVAEFNHTEPIQVCIGSAAEGRARYPDSIDKGGASNFLQEAILPDRESEEERLEQPMQTSPFSFKNFMANRYLLREPPSGKSESVLLEESLFPTSQIYKENSEKKVKIEKRIKMGKKKPKKRLKLKKSLNKRKR